MRRFTRSLAIALLALIHVLVLFAGFFAPYDPGQQDREHSFAAPDKVHFFDAQSRFHLRPFVVSEDGAATRVHLFVRGTYYNIAGVIPASMHLFGTTTAQPIHLLGTDRYGRDQLSRILWAGQISLFAGLCAAALSMLIALAFGTIAGFYGGVCDSVLMRIAEVTLALPWLLVLFMVRACLPLHISSVVAFLLVTAVMGLVGWARPARLVRGVALAAKDSAFVMSARGFGASDFYLIRRHVLPETFTVLWTQFALLVPQYIMAEVTLSYLGLGVGEPTASWGSLLASAQSYNVVVSYWWMMLPAAAIIPVVLTYNYVAQALQRGMGDAR